MAPTCQPFEWVDLEELFARSDVISLHCPLTADTAGLVNLRGREGLAVVPGVAGLTTDGTLGSAGILGRLGFDDVGGRRLGRGGGILASRRELLL